MFAVEIHYYGAVEPTRIPVSNSDRSSAESYFEQIRTAVIEAQRHSERQLWISPLDQGDERRVVNPREIQRVVLVDHPEAPAA